MELDHLSNQGSIESSTSSLQASDNTSLPTASTDSLVTDTGKCQSAVFVRILVLLYKD